MKTKTIQVIATCLMVIGGAQFSNAQLLKKLKDNASGKTESSSSSKGSSKMIGESEINDEFSVDEFGVNGIYFAQTKNGITKNKFEFEVCKDKSKAKGADGLPACISFKYEIPESNTTIWRNKIFNDGYAHPENLIRSNRLFFSGEMFGDVFQIEPGVLFMSASNWKGVIIGTYASFRKDDFDLKSYINSGHFYVKNKEDLYTPPIKM